MHGVNTDHRPVETENAVGLPRPPPPPPPRIFACKSISQNFPFLNILSECMLCLHIKTNVKVNAGDFLKRILNVGDLTREFKCRFCIIHTADSRPLLGKWSVWPEI